MKITCPHCGIVGSANESLPGEKVRCPQCAKVFRLMDQKVACPHCRVVGSVGAATVGAKFKCPQCEKVFLLTSELLAGPLVRGEVEEQLSAGEEAFSGGSAEAVPESAAREEFDSWMSPESEPEPATELGAAFEAAFAAETETEHEAEPALGSSVPEAEVAPSVEESSMEEVSSTEEGGEKNASTLPTEVCDGCGESFHPDFMQEVDGKLFCGVCQLRTAASDSKGKGARFCGRELRGMLAAFLLLGLLALALFALMRLGIL